MEFVKPLSKLMAFDSRERMNLTGKLRNWPGSSCTVHHPGSDSWLNQFSFTSRQAATVDSDEEDSAEEDDDIPDSNEHLTAGGPDDKTVHGSGFKVRMIEGLLKSEFVAKVAESEWVKKNITKTNITLQLQLHLIKGTLTINMPPAPSDRIWLVSFK